MARSRLLRSRQARRAEETRTPQEDLDTLRGPEQSDDGLADDVRQRSHPGWIAHGIVVSTPREVLVHGGVTRAVDPASGPVPVTP
jgi:hypothetical protein